MKVKVLGIPFNISDNDIIPNDIHTYPPEIIKMLNNYKGFRNDLCEFLVSNKCNIVCWHSTRLTKLEIADIQKNGISTDDHKGFFESKIKNLPPVITSDVKQKLLKYIRSINSSQTEGKVYASYGIFDLKKDLRNDKIFLKNWGGETIYNYYEKGFTNDLELNYIKQELNKISFPCIVCLRINFSNLIKNNTYFFDDFCNQLENFNISEISGNLCYNRNGFEVVDLLKLNHITI